MRFQNTASLEFTHFSNSGDALPKTTKKKCDILLTVFGRIPIAQKNNQKECRAVNGTKIALKAKVQLANFMGKVFTHFSKPTRRFIEECIYGIQASGDTKLSSIVRTIDDDIRPIYTEKKAQTQSQQRQVQLAFDD